MEGKKAITLTYGEVKKLWNDIIALYNKKYPDHKIQPNNFSYFDGKTGLIRSTSKKVPKDMVPLWKFIAEHDHVKRHENEWNRYQRKSSVNEKRASKFTSSNFDLIYKHLKKNQDAKTKPGYVFGGGVHRDLYFKLIGQPSAEAFIEHAKGHLRSGHYTGLFYFPKDTCVSQFEFEITHQFGETRGRITNLHLSKETFEGHGQAYGRHWNFHLRGESALFLNLIIDTGDEENKDNFDINNFKVTVNGILKGGPFICEAFLIRNASKNKSHDIVHASRYLMLCRRTQGIDPLEPFDFQTLQKLQISKSHRLSHYKEFFNKTFRILNITPSKKLVSQSQIKIEDDLSCVIAYPVRPNTGQPPKYKGYLSVKMNQPNRLFIQAYTKETFYAYTVINTHEKDGAYSGSFCISDSDSQTANPVSGNFVMVSDSTMSDDEIVYFSKADFFKRYKVDHNHPNYEMYRILCDVVERRLPNN